MTSKVADDVCLSSDDSVMLVSQRWDDKLKSGSEYKTAVAIFKSRAFSPNLKVLRSCLADFVDQPAGDFFGK